MTVGLWSSMEESGALVFAISMRTYSKRVLRRSPLASQCTAVWQVPFNCAGSRLLRGVDGGVQPEHLGGTRNCEQSETGAEAAATCIGACWLIRRGRGRNDEFRVENDPPVCCCSPFETV